MHHPPTTRHDCRAKPSARPPEPALEPRSADKPSSPEPTVEEEVETVVSLGRPWNVIVWDDPVNLMSYVVYVFQKLFGFTQEIATQHMMEVHSEGKSLVASADREKAEFYVSRLHGYGLQATLEQAQDD
jgi:ATP-dependent Clp protease adaptor protein ClpS